MLLSDQDIDFAIIATPSITHAEIAEYLIKKGYIVHGIIRRSSIVKTDRIDHLYEEPWKKKDDLERLNTIVYVSLELIRKITILMYPIIPESACKVLKIFNIQENKIDFKSIKSNNFLKLGEQITNINILFKKVEKND